MKVRGWQALGVLVCITSFLTTFFLDVPAWKPAVPLGVTLLVWNTLHLEAVRRGWRTRRATRWIAVALEACAPWALFGGIIVVAGSRVAFEAAIFGPCLMFGGVVMLTTLRMDPRMSFIAGLISAACYVVIARTVAVQFGDAAVADQYGWPRSLVRFLFITAGGGVGALVAYGLREAVGGAVSRLRAADLFGKYQLEREIASGGMGTVWLARYCPEGGFVRPAALKRIHPHLARDERFVSAFRREAELGARLVHHNIVQVLDFGRVDETYFLAMEYVDGVSCAALINRAALVGETLPPPTVALIGRGVLEGLAYAHVDATDADGAPLRVVHRDLAPQNVLVSTSGLVKITDFGIARTLKEHTSAVTAAVGHAGHVAPEHLEGKPIDARSDLFLVGVLLWELLCGRALFVKRDNDAATMRALLLEPAPPPSTVDARFAPWDGFLQRALEKDPAWRYAGAAEMLRALELVVSGVGAGGVGIATAEELGAIVRASGKGGIHDAKTVLLGGQVGTPSDERTVAQSGTTAP